MVRKSFILRYTQGQKASKITHFYYKKSPCRYVWPLFVDEWLIKEDELQDVQSLMAATSL